MAEVDRDTLKQIFDAILDSLERQNDAPPSETTSARLEAALAMAERLEKLEKLVATLTETRPVYRLEVDMETMESIRDGMVYARLDELEGLVEAQALRLAALEGHTEEADTPKDKASAKPYWMSHDDYYGGDMPPPDPKPRRGRKQ